MNEEQGTAAKTTVSRRRRSVPETEEAVSPAEEAVSPAEEAVSPPPARKPPKPAVFEAQRQVTVYAADKSAVVVWQPLGVFRDRPAAMAELTRSVKSDEIVRLVRVLATLAVQIGRAHV